MAKSKEVAATDKPAAAPKESRYNSLSVRWFKEIESFDPVAALTALAEVDGLVIKSTTAKKSGKITFQVDTAESAKVSGRGRPKRLVSKEAEKAAIGLLRAAMKDPDKAAKITELLASAESGKDVSGELSQLVGIGS
jgi:hypothetical protein